MQPLTISGQGLKVDDVVAVAHGRPVTLDPAALPAIERSQAAVERLVDEGRIAYGITTGFGRFKDKLISPD
jgi:histidine ammonia-lyase